jgi:hypothetical protein
MLRDNTRSHTATTTQDLMVTFGWEKIDPPSPYSPDLAPNDFHVFLHLKTFLGGRWFHDDNEVKEPLTRDLHRRRHHSTMQRYKNWCPATSSSTTPSVFQHLVSFKDSSSAGWNHSSNVGLGN